MADNYFEHCDKAAFNASGETAPAYAILQVTNWTADLDGRELFTFKKPDGKGKLYLINGPIPIPPQSGGDATRSDGMFALIEGTPPSSSEELVEWGPKAGSWALSSTGAGFLLYGAVVGSPASQPGFPTAAATTRIRVSQLPGSASKIEAMDALLIGNLPAYQLKASESEVKLTPGYEEDVIIPLVWEKVGLSDVQVPMKDKDDNPIRMGGLNIKWPYEIRADFSDKKVVLVSGTIETRNVYAGGGDPGEKKVFVVRDLIYPPRIVAGTVSSSVAGGDWVQSVDKVLTGRPLQETSIQVTNPDEWDSDAQAYAVAIEDNEGNWYGIDLECKEEETSSTGSG
jgi:hypothetical protein